MSTVVHIVSFRYKDPASAPEVARRFTALPLECRLDNGNGQHYILSLVGGSNNSPEGRTKDLQHTFILTFPDKESRDYYIDHDPAHIAFKQFVRPLLEDSFVFDFADGEYQL